MRSECWRGTVAGRILNRRPVFTAAIGLAAFALASCGGSSAPSTPASFGAIDRERLLAADHAPGDWLTSGRDFGKSHFSPLTQINRDNIARLGFAWQFSTGT